METSNNNIRSSIMSRYDKTHVRILFKHRQKFRLAGEHYSVEGLILRDDEIKPYITPNGRISIPIPEFRKILKRIVVKELNPQER